MTDDWETRRWGDLVQFEYGSPVTSYVDGGRYPVYGTNGRFAWTDEFLDQGPSVIIGRKGAYRGVHFAPGPFWAVDTGFFVRPRVELDMRWAYYSLLTQDIKGLDSGSAIPSTSRDSLVRLPVQVPPIEEQRAIASVLGALDDKVELNRRMNEALEALSRAIFTSWFVNFDPVRAKAEGRQPVGMDAETAALFPDSFDDSPLVPIPSGWRAVPIGEVVTVVGGSTPRTGEPSFWGGTIPFATPKDLAGLQEPLLTATGRSVTAAGAEQVSSGVLPPGTVLLSSRAPIGYLAISDIPVVVNQGLIAMKCGGPLPNYYVLNWARHNIDRIVANANGTTFLEISKTNFRPIPALVPSDDTLRLFSTVVAPLYDRITANIHEARVLNNLRDQLLPKLVSGEIRVPVD